MFSTKFNYPVAINILNPTDQVYIFHQNIISIQGVMLVWVCKSRHILIPVTNTIGGREICKGSEGERGNLAIFVSPQTACIFPWLSSAMSPARQAPIMYLR